MKIEKNKIVFAAVLAVIVLFLVCYGISLSMEDESEEQLTQTEIPILVKNKYFLIL